VSPCLCSGSTRDATLRSRTLFDICGYFGIAVLNCLDCATPCISGRSALLRIVEHRHVVVGEERSPTTRHPNQLPSRLALCRILHRQYPQPQYAACHARACNRFFAWCEARGLTLSTILDNPQILWEKPYRSYLTDDAQALMLALFFNRDRAARTALGQFPPPTFGMIGVVSRSARPLMSASAS
jgi:hypothetical protein